MNRLRLAVFLVLAILPRIARPDEPVTFVIIVNAARDAELTRQDLANIFMKRMTRWSDKRPINPVERFADSPLRAEFSRAILHRSVDAMQAYWQQQIFSGRDIPPSERRSDAEVLEYVRTRAGAIGYVSSATPTEGVYVVRWK